MSNESEVAEPDSWETNQMPAQTAAIPFHHRYSYSEMRNIKRGLIPKEMEDKWFMFVVKDVLFVHRSWTGNCIYRVNFTHDGSDYVTSDATVNRDPEQHTNTDANHDVELLAFLINNLLLDKNVPFPLPSNVPASTPPGIYQHHVSGTGYPETSGTEERKPETR